LKVLAIVSVVLPLLDVVNLIEPELAQAKASSFIHVGVAAPAQPERLVSNPPFGTKFLSGTAHLHRPVTQLNGQTCPHVPQFCASVCILVHVAPQQRKQVPLASLQSSELDTYPAGGVVEVHTLIVLATSPCVSRSASR
jgi:hypothetical protein